MEMNNTVINENDNKKLNKLIRGFTRIDDGSPLFSSSVSGPSQKYCYYSCSYKNLSGCKAQVNIKKKYPNYYITPSTNHNHNHDIDLIYQNRKRN